MTKNKKEQNTTTTMGQSQGLIEAQNSDAQCEVLIGNKECPYVKEPGYIYCPLHLANVEEALETPDLALKKILMTDRIEPANDSKEEFTFDDKVNGAFSAQITTKDMTDEEIIDYIVDYCFGHVPLLPLHVLDVFATLGVDKAFVAMRIFVFHHMRAANIWDTREHMITDKENTFTQEELKFMKEYKLDKIIPTVALVYDLHKTVNEANEYCYKTRNSNIFNLLYKNQCNCNCITEYLRAMCSVLKESENPAPMPSICTENTTGTYHVKIAFNEHYFFESTSSPDYVEILVDNYVVGKHLNYQQQAEVRHKIQTFLRKHVGENIIVTLGACHFNSMDYFYGSLLYLEDNLFLRPHYITLAKVLIAYDLFKGDFGKIEVDCDDKIEMYKIGLPSMMIDFMINGERTYYNFVNESQPWL